ncbi:uncharacterized protein BDR25DRAFT_339411 [Lindgomyces ingoldianus]|uniref:Uncharacterized protein n=1 Tax=Lindgomyces ingoldianus TaxID=673940 RepID=A0ACB6RAT9_9PLEO|nr:uncharacterized protein BDR25DRAFT_339411 [Lindgomyces ingoldianus]KAF2476384.1 hypothetical protein BDR25DRAFT_339411 [Lindgomyces ingoldianus]
MSGLFKRKEERFFPPPPTPLPRRKLMGRVMDEQEGCAFLTRLPPEVRNEIYELVFGTNMGIYDSPLKTVATPVTTGQARGFILAKTPKEGGKEASKEVSEAPKIQTPGPPAHPLSLLLTCQKINQEATLLAFNNFTFTTRSYTSFWMLKDRSQHLSPEQFSAISHLAYAIESDGVYYSYMSSDFLANSLALFAGLKRLELRIKKRHPREGQHNINLGHFPMSGDTARMSIIRRCVPDWWLMSLTQVTNGRSLAWQAGETWTVEWPQYDLLEKEMDVEHEWGGCAVNVALPNIAKNLPGASLCSCGCDEVRWWQANLVQKSGRKVEVDVVYYGDTEEVEREEREGTYIRLKEGAERLDVKEVDGGNGILWEADKKYWEDLRRRKAWNPFPNGIKSLWRCGKSE